MREYIALSKGLRGFLLKDEATIATRDPMMQAQNQTHTFHRVLAIVVLVKHYNRHTHTHTPFYREALINLYTNCKQHE
jgi:hypothetical protein